MRDRAAEGALARRALRIDVDPLMIAGAVCEFRDARLIERDPGGDPHLLADVLAQIAQRHCVRHDSLSLAFGTRDLAAAAGRNARGRDLSKPPVCGSRSQSARGLPGVIAMQETCAIALLMRTDINQYIQSIMEQLDLG